MTFSVVLIVYNQLALTRACLESLRGTSEPFELCVVDNASTDGTEEFLRTAAPPGPRRPPSPPRGAHWQRRPPPPPPAPRRYHRNADNVGLIRALNQGAALAGGD